MQHFISTGIHSLFQCTFWMCLAVLLRIMGHNA